MTCERLQWTYQGQNRRLNLHLFSPWCRTGDICMFRLTGILLTRSCSHGFPPCRQTTSARLLAVTECENRKEQTYHKPREADLRSSSCRRLSYGTAMLSTSNQRILSSSKTCQNVPHVVLCNQNHNNRPLQW